MTEEVEGLVKQLYARSLMQRTFMAVLLRRLALDVPSLDVELLQEQLYLLTANHPHTPGDSVSKIEEAGREELRDLIEMVEGVIKEVREN